MQDFTKITAAIFEFMEQFGEMGHFGFSRHKNGSFELTFQGSRFQCENFIHFLKMVAFKDIDVVYESDALGRRKPKRKVEKGEWRDWEPTPKPLTTKKNRRR